MKSIVKTAGSFDKVLASCRTIGERYQPKATSLSITAMSELQERSQQTAQAGNRDAFGVSSGGQQQTGKFCGYSNIVGAHRSHPRSVRGFQRRSEGCDQPEEHPDVSQQKKQVCVNGEC